MSLSNYTHLWQPGGLDWYMEHCFGIENLTAEFADANIEYLLATDQTDGQTIGFLKLVLQKPMPGGQSANALYLEKIYLLPAFFGRGIGQNLLQFVLEKAVQLGREAVWLMVMKTGPRKVYERAGFKTVGEMPIDFELLHEHERGLWVMVKWLKN